MKKALSLLMIVCLMLAVLTACTPKQGNQKQTQTTTTAAGDSISWNSDEPTETNETDTTNQSGESGSESAGTNEQGSGQPSGGLEVGVDTDDKFGPITPLG